jgi:hypothetical protein
MNRLSFRRDLERVRDIPFFPIVPLVPLTLALASLVVNGLLLWRVSRLNELLEARAAAA